MQPTVEERSSVHLFIHSVIHFAAVHWLVSQYGKQGNHSAGARTATLHAPHPHPHARPHPHPRPLPGPSSVSRAVSQLGSQPGQSTFSIDVARLRTHIADSWTKQSPVSNSVRHSLTESCLPFISICQSGQQAAGCCSKNSSSSCQLELLFCLPCFGCGHSSPCFLLYIVSYALFYLQHCVLEGWARCGVASSATAVGLEFFRCSLVHGLFGATQTVTVSIHF